MKGKMDIREGKGGDVRLCCQSDKVAAHPKGNSGAKIACQQRLHHIEVARLVPLLFSHWLGATLRIACLWLDN